MAVLRHGDAILRVVHHMTVRDKSRVLESLVSVLALVSFTRAKANMNVRADFFRTQTATESAVSLRDTRNAAYRNTRFVLPLSGEAPTGTLLITSANNGQTFQNLKIVSKTRNCVTIVGAANITIQNVEIGPCGGRGIEISKSNGVNIYDSYIHTETLSPGCCDNNDGIYAHNGSEDILVQGNVIAYGESNVEALGVTRIRVVGNFLVNPRGPKPRGQNFQCYNGCSEVTVSNNYALSSTDTEKYLYPENQEDSINFGMSDSITARDNFITGGHSRSGCGLIADDRANSVQFVGNRVLNTGQCGIGIADGSNQVVSGNKIYNANPISGGGNTALYVWKQYKPACGPVTVSYNIADALKPDGTHSGYWDGGGCGPVILNGNTFDEAADRFLTSTSAVFAPPSIPPQPKNCVATSAYSNNTSLPPCDAVK
jgi:parallel beta helix pectate lyase-like protein